MRTFQNRILRSSILALLILYLGGATPSWAQSRSLTPPSRKATSKVNTRGVSTLKQMVTPGFEELPLDRKLFAYWLMQAMEAGRDIAWTQVSHFGLEIRHLLEAIWQKKSLLTPKEKKAVTEYYFTILANNGTYRLHANQKFVFEGLGASEFQAMLLRIQIPLPSPGIQQAIFDPEFEKYRIAPTGADPIAQSGVNFYGPGMTQEKFAELPELLRNHILSYPEVDAATGATSLTLQKIGSRFHDRLSAVSFFIDRAKEYATPEENKILSAYQKSWETGSPDDLEAAEILWVKHQPSDIAFSIGFVETYDDPHGTRGTWIGFILLMNQSAEAVQRSSWIRASAADYEAKMPVDEAFKKKGAFNPPNSEGAYLLYASGGDDAQFFAGVNLPNSPEIKKTFGSKSFTIYNKIFDIGASSLEQYLPGELEMLYLPEYHSLLKQFKVSDYRVRQVEFHEILGHGSGQDAPGVNSQEALGGDYAAMEEARAELGATYHLTDSDALRAILPADWSLEKVREFSKFCILQFFSKHLQSYLTIANATAIRQAHQLGRQMIFTHLLREGALAIELSGQGLPMIRMSSLDQIRASLGRFWAIIQKTKSTGDLPALKALIADLGAFTAEQRQWAKAMQEPAQKLTVPGNTIYLPPTFNLVQSKNGQITDVTLGYLAPRAPIEAAIDYETARRIGDARRCLILLDP